MKIFLAICKDRHIDVQVYPFTTRNAAILRAKQFVSEMTHAESEVVEREIDGWEWYCRYDEENSAYVIGTDLLGITYRWLRNVADGLRS